MDTVEEKLEKWIRRHLFNKFEEQSCSHFVLHHLGGNGKTGSEVLTVEATGEDERITEMVADILDAASSDATGFGVLQTYVLFAFYGKETKKAHGRFTLRAQPNGSDETADSGEQLTEPPTPQGLLTQMMRHNEAILRTSTMSMGNTMAGLQVMISKQASAIEKLLGDRLETIDVFENMMSLKHERELDIMRETEKIERRKQLGDKLGPLVAVAVNKMTGKNLLPAANPQTLALSELFKSLTPEQLEKMQTILAPDQLMVILSLASQFVDKKPEQAQTPTG